MSYVRRLRLVRAAHRLTYTDQSVIGIAMQAGYEAHESFTRAFRAAYCQSPSRFRNLSRNGHGRESENNVNQGGFRMEVTK